MSKEYVDTVEQLTEENKKMRDDIENMMKFPDLTLSIAPKGIQLYIDPSEIPAPVNDKELDSVLQDAIMSNIARINRIEFKNEELRKLRLKNSLNSVSAAHEFAKLFESQKQGSLIDSQVLFKSGLGSPPQSRPFTVERATKASSRPSSAPIADPTIRFYSTSVCISQKSNTPMTPPSPDRPQTAAVLMTLLPKPALRAKTASSSRPKTAKIRWKDDIAA